MQKNADTNDPGEILLRANDADIPTCQGNSSTLKYGINWVWIK